MIRRPPRSTLFPYTTPLPICRPAARRREREQAVVVRLVDLQRDAAVVGADAVEHRDEGVAERVDVALPRSEEHTSELQSRPYLVCRLLLEKKKKTTTIS